jgi:hypothetical protein
MYLLYGDIDWFHGAQNVTDILIFNIILINLRI